MGSAQPSLFLQLWLSSLCISNPIGKSAAFFKLLYFNLADL
jgi:hypothetical protein